MSRFSNSGRPKTKLARWQGSLIKPRINLLSSSFCRPTSVVQLPSSSLIRRFDGGLVPGECEGQIELGTVLDAISPCPLTTQH